MEQDFLKKKELLIGLAVFVFSLMILISGTWFLTSKIVDSSAGLEIKKAEIETVYQNWERISQNKKDLQKMKDDLEKINNAFIPSDAPYDFINLLEELAKSTASSYEINLMTLGAQDQEKEKAVTFQIEFVGSFNNLMHFLRYLENMKYYTQVESLQIGKIGEGGTQIKADLKNLPPGSVQGLITLKAMIN